MENRVAMPYDHPGIDCSADRVRLSQSELQQYLRGEITLDDRYVEQKKRERDFNNTNPVEEEETLFWNRLWEQRREQRELLKSGVRVVLNERGQLIPAEEDITVDGGVIITTTMGWINFLKWKKSVFYVNSNEKRKLY